MEDNLNLPDKNPHKKISDEELLAVLSYVPFLNIIVYVIKEDNQDVRFHAKQGLVIFGLYILSFLPYIGVLFLFLALIATLIGAAKAYKGEKYKIPYIYDVSKKINF